MPQPTGEQVNKLLSSARDIYKNYHYKFGKREGTKEFECNKCKLSSTAEFGWFYNSETNENFHFNNGNIPCFQEYLRAERHIEVYRPSPPDQKQQLDQQSVLPVPSYEASLNMQPVQQKQSVNLSTRPPWNSDTRVRS